MEGFYFVAGIDEVGRGPLAGPVVAAAVMLPFGVPVPAVFDSKQVKESAREELARRLYELPGIAIAVAEIGPEVIDEINILQATHRAMRQAASALARVDFLLIDGNPVKHMPVACKSMVKGDARCASIAAASIIAKVYRDALMVKYDEVYPGYGFAGHKGYGTAKHLAALRELGPCPIHRKTFAPVRDLITPPPEQMKLF